MNYTDQGMLQTESVVAFLSCTHGFQHRSSRHLPVMSQLVSKLGHKTRHFPTRLGRIKNRLAFNIAFIPVAKAILDSGKVERSVAEALRGGQTGVRLLLAAAHSLLPVKVMMKTV